MKRVFIGVGHGGADPGAVSGGLCEKDINLVMALAMRDELVRCGVAVGISREEDRTVGLAEEIRMCNAFQPDLAVEVHNNAGGGEGFEVFRATGGHSVASLELAQAIERHILTIGHKSRGVKTWLNSQGRDWYGWLRECACPAVLCEGAFLDSALDRQRVATAEKQRAFGVAYAHGVLECLKMPIHAARAPLYAVVHQVIALTDRSAAEQYAAKCNAERAVPGWYKVIEVVR